MLPVERQNLEARRPTSQAHILSDEVAVHQSRWYGPAELLEAPPFGLNKIAIHDDPLELVALAVVQCRVTQVGADHIPCRPKMF